MTFSYPLFFLTLPGVLLPGVLGMPLGVGRSVAVTRKTMRLGKVKGAGGAFSPAGFSLYPLLPKGMPTHGLESYRDRPADTGGKHAQVVRDML